MNFAPIVAGSPEDQLCAPATAAALARARRSERRDGAGADGQAGSAQAISPSISPSSARKGEIDPIVGRDEEIRQIVDILMRRRQNNPILTGEAGVGKTAVVEGFALRIAKGDVPPALKDVSLRTLDIGLLAGGREHEGRVREPPAAGHRRGAGVAQADHPVHRRSAHADRRGRRGRAPATPRTC